MNIAVTNSAERRVARGETTIRTPIHASRITHHAPRSTEQGIALVIVMISIFVLAMLAGGFAYSMKVETKLASNGNSEEELQWLGRSGVEYARWVLANSMADPTKPYDSLDQPWATGSGFLGPTNAPIGEVQNPFTLGSGNVKWKISDLERKWNINTMLQPGGQDLLQNAFMNMGLDAGADMTLIMDINHEDCMDEVREVSKRVPGWKMYPDIKAGTGLPAGAKVAAVRLVYATVGEVQSLDVWGPGPWPPDGVAKLDVHGKVGGFATSTCTISSV